MDTACSSSPTALHLAIESLRKGRCRAALVGEVNLYSHPTQAQKKSHSSEWLFLNFGAGNETRTRDADLGKVVLYQLSYSRVLVMRIL